MLIQCQYCPTVSKNLAEAINHFEAAHRNKGEYVVFEIMPDMIEPIKEGNSNEN